MKRVLMVLLALVLVAVVAVTVVAESPDPDADSPKGGLALIGKVVDIQDEALTVETRYGSWSVQVSDETVFRLPGEEEGSLDDIEVDKPIQAMGEVTAVGTMAADLITVPRRPQTPMTDLLGSIQRARKLRGTLRGQVVEIGEAGLTVQVGEDTVELVVDEDTVYRVRDVEEAGLTDMAPEDLVVVQLSPEQEGVAKGIAVVSERQMRRLNTDVRLAQRVQRAIGGQGVRGQVTALDSTGLTLETPRGEIRVDVTEDTRVGREGDEVAFSEIVIGDTILVFGMPDITCPINAKGIRIMPPQDGAQD